MTANPERGEVALDLDGQEFVLCAELGRVAAWTNEIGIQNLLELQARIALADPKVLFVGARALCVSPNGKDIVRALHFRHFAKVQTALGQALLHGLEQPGNGEALAMGATPTLQ